MPNMGFGCRLWQSVVLHDGDDGLGDSLQLSSVCALFQMLDRGAISRIIYKDEEEEEVEKSMACAEWGHSRREANFARKECSPDHRRMQAAS